MYYLLPFLKISLHYRVKHKSLKCCNCSTSPWS